jgi:hypothetical protein
MIDSVDYESSSPWPTEPRNQGPSLERVDPNGEPNDPLNWKASNEKYGTPGDTNSIIPSYDIGFLNSSDISFEENGRDIYVKAQVHNFGTERADSAEVLFFSINPDTCVDTIGEVKRIGPIDSGSVVTALSDLWVAQPNSYIVCAYTTLLDTTDFDTTNNKISKSLMVGYTAPEIVINEIMYKPETGKAEWIELFNRTKDSIDVKGWELGDTTETTSIIDTGYIIPPGGFLIVTEDDSLFRLKYPEVDSNIVIEQKRWKTLSNDDEIILKSSRGFITEDVKYKNDWMWQYEGIKGISLERVNPDLDPNDKANWWACTDTKMATPGEPNSVFQPIPPSAELKAEPNPFCPDEERTLISYEVSPRSLVTIRVYDVRGREVRVVMDQEQKGGKGTIIWDGRDDDGTILPIGIYVIYLEACDTYGGNITILKNTVVVAKHLK